MLLSNFTYRSLLQRVAVQTPVEKLRGKRVLITGASGLIGSAVVDLLLFLNEEQATECRVVAVGRDIGRLKARFGERGDLAFEQYEEVIAGKRLREVDALVLAASPASPNLFVENPSAVLKANTEDVAAVLMQLDPATRQKVCYVSSSEVYGDAVAPASGHIETTLGEINDSDPRSCYALGKHRAEEICRRHDELCVTMVRPGHIYGPTARHADRRVSSAWPFDVAAGRDIVMKSDGSQIRSYTHCLDCASAILTVLMRGESGEVYNISNRDSIVSIRRLAQFLCEAAGVQLICKAPSETEKAAFNPMLNSSLDAGKLEALGWRGLIGAKEGLSSTVEILRTLKRD